MRMRSRTGTDFIRMAMRVCCSRRGRRTASRIRRVGEANGSRERAPDDRLCVPTLTIVLLKVGTALSRLCPPYEVIASRRHALRQQLSDLDRVERGALQELIGGGEHRDRVAGGIAEILADAPDQDVVLAGGI